MGGVWHLTNTYKAQHWTLLIIRLYISQSQTNSTVLDISSQDIPEERTKDFFQVLEKILESKMKKVGYICVLFLWMAGVVKNVVLASGKWNLQFNILIDNQSHDL